MSERLYDGRYEVTGTLGEGAQAVTLEARDAARGGRAVAIKRFDVRGASRWKDVELAEREARVLASLDHPLLPRYVEHFEEGGALYLVMEKIDGESIASLRKRGVTLDERDVRRFLRDASDALDYLHGRAPPLIHRDIKPTNVIRRADGSFAFVDFGAVRDRLRPEGGSTVVGTFGYMAPEQFQGRALPASDVYAAGATALAMLTGAEPESLPHKGLRIDVRAALGKRVDKRLVAAIEAMTDPDPEKRAARIAPLLRDDDRDGGHVEGRKRRDGRGRAAKDERRRARRAARARRRAETRLAGPWRWLIPLLWTLWGLAWLTHPSVLVMVLAIAPLIALRRFATVRVPASDERETVRARVAIDGGDADVRPTRVASDHEDDRDIDDRDEEEAPSPRRATRSPK